MWRITVPVLNSLCAEQHFFIKCIFLATSFFFPLLLTSLCCLLSKVIQVKYDCRRHQNIYFGLHVWLMSELRWEPVCKLSLCASKKLPSSHEYLAEFHTWENFHVNDWIHSKESQMNTMCDNLKVIQTGYSLQWTLQIHTHTHKHTLPWNSSDRAWDAIFNHLNVNLLTAVKVISSQDSSCSVLSSSPWWSVVCLGACTCSITVPH